MIARYSVQELRASRLRRPPGLACWRELTGCSDVAKARSELAAWARLLPTTPLRLLDRQERVVIERRGRVGALIH